MLSTEDYRAYRDEFGQTAPLLASDGQRMPPAEGFEFGPAIGEEFPDFRLKASSGEWVNLKQDIAQKKAALVFFRSAVW